MRIVKLEERHLDALSEIDAVSHAPWSKESFKSELDNAVAFYHVAESDEGVVLGYIGYWWSFFEVQITFLAVHPDYRRQGIAEKLIAHIYEELAEMDVETIQLEVRAGNEPAIRLYKKCGFVEVGRRPRYYGGKEDAILMDLTIERNAEA
ncbi:MAG: ribosomal protein S18-alanine N-acetyltransferase [Clostridia bacterium]|nr:ribosomal protein S18-alanine N-acetyltransferase [Clostridia bacterium]